MNKTWLLVLMALSSHYGMGQTRDSITYFDPALSRFDPGETVQFIRPLVEDGELHNPHIGITTFQRLEGDSIYPGMRWDDSHAPLSFATPPPATAHSKNYPATRVAYIRWKWSDLEPEPGKIRFEVIENALVAAAQRGQTLEVRFQPFTGEDLPEWFWKTGARVDTPYRSWRKVSLPDHNDERYIKYFGRFITALGKRFDGRKNLDCVDLAYGGEWGEMGGNASAATARKLVDIFYKAFPTTKLILMAGSPGCEYASKHTSRDVGWRADCFGDLSKAGWRKRDTTENNWNHMFVAYPSLYELDGLQEKWKTGPVILETCGSIASWYRDGYDIDFIFALALRLHASVLMPKSVGIPEEIMPKVIALNNKLGYRFAIYNMIMPKSISTGQQIRIRTTIDNQGVAPIYYQYRFAFKITQGEKEFIYHSGEDIRRWMPLFSYFEDTFKLPAGFTTGEIKVSCAIVDDNDKPAVRLAMKDIDEGGWHPLSKIVVE